MRKPKQISPLTVPLGIMYCTLRYAGNRLMSIKFTHRGREWKADTIEEALALRHTLEERDSYDEQARVHHGFDTGDEEYIWTPDLVTELVETVGDLQLLMIRILYDKKSLTSAELVAQLGLDSEVALAGVLSGLSKRLKKMGMVPNHLYTVFVSWDGKAKSRTFRLNWQFRLAAESLDWPQSWVKEWEGKNAAATKQKARK